MPANECVVERPAILRFSSDTFMEELLQLLAQSPGRLSEWVAQPETWRQPMRTARVAPAQNQPSRMSYLLERTHRLAHNLPPGKALTVASSNLPVPCPEPSTEPLKLFQSAHQRFYLVSASLVFDEFGFPDRGLDPVKNERASFVMRRRVPPAGFDAAADPTPDTSSWDEYAFVESVDGHSWRKSGTGTDDAARKLAPGEDQLAMFPMSFDDRCKRSRQVLSGLIPVGKREAWMGAGHGTGNVQGDAVELEGAMSPRKALLLTDVIEPWKELVERARMTRQELNLSSNNPSNPKKFPNFDADGDRSGDEALALRTAREQIQTVSWYILLDFAKFLEEYVPDVWSVIDSTSLERDLDDDEKALVRVLNDTHLPAGLYLEIENTRRIQNVGFFDLSGVANHAIEKGIDGRGLTSLIYKPRSLRDALVAIRAQEENLEAVQIAYVRGTEPFPRDDAWPQFLFPLCDPDPDLPGQLEPGDPAAPLPALNVAEITGATDDTMVERIEALMELVDRVLPAESSTPEPETLIASTPVLDGREGWFVTRCVLERPNCGPLFPALVSESSQPFQLAQFFDPDAPMRPVRIPMPVDISLAGLRKFKKNASFVMSDMLCGMVGKIKKTTFADLVLSVLPWPFHKDLPDTSGAKPCEKGGVNFGIICSLSIPIVTLCALILLIIMVSLFDIFFRWLPYLFVCLPIIGLRGKK